MVRFTFHLCLRFFASEIRAPFSDGKVAPRACSTKIVLLRLLRVVFSSNVTGVVAVSADGERKWRVGG